MAAFLGPYIRRGLDLNLESVGLYTALEVALSEKEYDHQMAALLLDTGKVNLHHQRVQPFQNGDEGHGTLDNRFTPLKTALDNHWKGSKLLLLHQGDRGTDLVLNDPNYKTLRQLQIEAKLKQLKHHVEIPALLHNPEFDHYRIPQAFDGEPLPDEDNFLLFPELPIGWETISFMLNNNGEEISWQLVPSQVHPFIAPFFTTPQQAQIDASRELDYPTRPAKLFAQMVYLSDPKEYLLLEEPTEGDSIEVSYAKRFFNIARALPQELQETVASYAMGFSSTRLTPHEREGSLKHFARLCELNIL